MRAIISAALTLSLLTNPLAFAKANPPATKGKRNFETVKKEKLKRLTNRLETIQKRIACIKKAQRMKELRECERKYPLVKRSKRKQRKQESQARKGKEAK
ncbi:MAG: hypothetical protein C6I00_02610 [Nitratiruptor sp.]|nr:hypothetical protein [Nitratiruptor sp.]NPA84177.1 hypothetical protein [Campylobacterota bacterium]